MMRSNIIFFAQDLNNKDNDILMQNNVTVDNMNKIQELMELTSQVSLKGKKVIDDKILKVFIYKDNFLIIIPTNSKDSSGREAPILLYSNINDDKELILKYLDNFLQIIDRQIDKKALKNILYDIRKDNMLNIKYIIVGVLVAIMLYLIAT